MTAQDQGAKDTLDDVESAGDDVAESMEEAEQGAQDTSESLIELDAAAAAASGSMMALGAGLQRVFDNTRDTRSELARTAVTVGATSREMESLASSVASTTFSTQEATTALSALASAGVDSQEELEAGALAADNLSDATGAAVEETSALAEQLIATDGELSTFSENTDAFAYAVENSRLEVRDFNRALEQIDNRDLEELEVSGLQAAQVLALLGEESNQSGRRLNREFRQAVENTDGDLEDLLEELELTEEQFREFNEEVGTGTEITDEYSSKANEAYTVTDQLRSVVDRATLRFSGLMEPVSALSPALFAAGSAGLFLSQVNVSAVIPSTAAATASHWANTAALTAKAGAARGAAAAKFLLTANTAQLATVTAGYTAAAWATVSGLTASTAASLSAASAKGVLAGAAGLAAAGVTALWTALGPLGLLALGLTAIVLGLAGVMKTDLFGAGDRAAAILGRVRGGAETLIAIFGELIGIGKELARIGLTAGVMALLAPFAAVLKLPDLLTSVGPRVKRAAMQLPERVVAGLASLGRAKYAIPILGPLLLAKDMITDPGRWIDAGRQIPSMIAGGIREAASEPVDAVAGVVGDAREFLPFSDAKRGPLSSLSESGGAFMSTFAGGVEGEGSTLASAMESTLGKTPLGQAAGAAAGAVGDAVGGEGGGGGPRIDVTVNQEIDASGDGSSSENLASSAQEIADLTIEEIVDALARETDFEPSGSPN